ncbi:MAG: HPF/RaiA family ribosome-associated protein [Chitinophagales bacterium]|nr:HPF/RaiA family ribosome-associated protein [Chitinophagales bacterium]MDW8427062.1 HPF/RaiA family ribosome-associated protein [Chitinophagales bacterium]
MKGTQNRNLPIQIHSIHFDTDRKLEQRIQEKLNKLNRFCSRIDGIQVILKLDHNKGVVKDKIAEIRVHVPGKTLYAEESSKLFEEAVDFAVDAIVRQVKKHMEKIRE